MNKELEGIRNDGSDIFPLVCLCMLRFIARSSFLTLLVLVGGHARAQVDWPTIGFSAAGTNAFTHPTLITHAGDGSQRLFVGEQTGQVWIIESNSVLPEAFLDIRPKLLSAGPEQGLLGLAFPPAYAGKGHFYADYTRSPDGAVVVSRFGLTTDPNVADTNSEEVLLVIPKPYNNHNGGQLAFGPEGFLYVGVGDGGAEGDPLNNGQKTTNLLGKLLRIDVENGTAPYGIPPGNPFVGNTNYAPEIWAYGLRNPWRFSFDRLKGDLYIGDVGQDQFEEIDFQPAASAGGQNYGWRIMEGPSKYSVPVGFTNFSSLTLPTVWYSHLGLPSDASAAVIGGYVYRGPSQPRMDGIYFYGDWVVGWIWGLKQNGSNWQSFALQTPIPPAFHLAISTFGEDDLGRLYVADYFRGTLYQLFDTRQVWTPSFSPTSGTINSRTVTVTCASTDADIHFTTNGVDPTVADPIISSVGTIQVVSGFTNKARAFRADLQPSAVGSAVFTLKVGTPFFTPTAGAISNYTPVTISTVTPGASIYYTTNGYTPTTNSLLYSGPVTISGGVTLRAIAVEPGYTDSAAAFATYSALRVATPVFNPPGGPSSNSIQVSISCATPSAVIHYTVDGTTPTTNAPVYTDAVLISQPTTLMAVAYRDDLGPSAVQSVFYSFIYFEHTVVTTLVGASYGGFTNAPGTLALFATPQGLCLDSSGNLLVGDRGNHVIRKVSLSGQVQTFAGSGTDGFQNGTVADAQFQDAAGVCRDPAGNVFVSEGGCGEWRIRKIDTNGTVTTVASVPSVCRNIGQIETDPGDTLYAGYGPSLNKITPDGQVTAIAGYGPYYAFIGVGLDQTTNVYATEEGQIWKIAPDGIATLFAGNPGTPGFSDGPASLALFRGLQDAVVDASGNVFLSDYTRIRKISAQGMVTSLAGTGVAGYVNGRGPDARFNNVTGLCLDTNGNLYVSDGGNNVIRKISPDTAGIGIADDWQIAHFGHIGIDPNADPDHDGMSNYAEFWAGTDPLNAGSVLRIESPLQISGGQPQIRWPTVVGKTYVVQYSTDLVSWNAVGTPVQGDGSVATVTGASTVSDLGPHYYRIALTSF
jgi:glucose/arabinose dehydrogenase